VLEDLDALAAERLPATVLDRGREQRERQAAERAKDRADSAWYEQQVAQLEAMSADERQTLVADAGERFGSYDPRHWQLKQRIEQLEASEADGEGEGGEDAS